MTIYKDYHIDATSASLKLTRRMPEKSCADEDEAKQQMAEWVAAQMALNEAADWVGSYEMYTWDPLVEPTPVITDPKE